MVSPREPGVGGDAGAGESAFVSEARSGSPATALALKYREENRKGKARGVGAARALRAGLFAAS